MSDITTTIISTEDADIVAPVACLSCGRSLGVTCAANSVSSSSGASTANEAAGGSGTDADSEHKKRILELEAEVKLLNDKVCAAGTISSYSLFPDIPHTYFPSHLRANFVLTLIYAYLHEQKTSFYPKIQSFVAFVPPPLTASPHEPRRFLPPLNALLALLVEEESAASYSPRVRDILQQMDPADPRHLHQIVYLKS